MTATTDPVRAVAEVYHRAGSDAGEAEVAFAVDLVKRFSRVDLAALAATCGWWRVCNRREAAEFIVRRFDSHQRCKLA